MKISVWRKFPLRKLYDAADRFCARHPRFGVPDLMRYIVIGNVVVYFLSMLSRNTDDQRHQRQCPELPVF